LRARIGDRIGLGDPRFHLIEIVRIDGRTVDRGGRAAIAAAETGDFVDFHIIRLQCFELGNARIAVRKPARHIAADTEFNARRRSRAKVRIEADDLLEAMERNVVRARKFAKHGFGEMTVLVLSFGEERDETHSRN
jgi:hypothetical protein